MPHLLELHVSMKIFTREALKMSVDDMENKKTNLKERIKELENA
jgi:hypothetical protein